MANVKQSGRVVVVVDCWCGAASSRVFNCDGRVVGEDVQKGDGVVGQLVRRRGLKISIDAVSSFAAAQWQGNHRTDLAKFSGVLGL